jgi:hypothetical protein
LPYAGGDFGDRKRFQQPQHCTYSHRPQPPFHLPPQLVALAGTIAVMSNLSVFEQAGPES